MDKDGNLENLNKMLWVLILVTVAFNILFLMRYNFEADSAFYVTLAQEQIRSKSLFPEGIYYSTGLFVLSPNLLVIPFLYMTDNLVLARQSAILILWGIIYLVLYKVFITKQENDVISFVLASSLFSVFYIDASVVSMHFYQGAYVCYLLFLLIFLLLMRNVIDNQRIISNKRLLTMLFLYIIANLGDIRNLLIWGIPGAISYMVFLYFKSGKNLVLLKSSKAEQKFVRILFDGILLSFIFFFLIAKLYGTGGASTGSTVITARDYGESFYAIITGLFGLFGNSYEALLFSSSGILKCINFFVALLFNLIIPVIAVKEFDNIKSDFCKFIILFSIISTFIYIIITFFTGAAIIEDRYLIPVYNNNILLFAVTGSYILQRYFKRFLRLGMFCVLSYVLLSNLLFFYHQKDSFMVQKFGTFAQGVEGVAEFLESNGLQYGYATFFNAEEYSVLSNNKVRIRGIKFDKDKIMPYNWLTSKHFYDPKAHIGESFLMITDEELKHFFPQGISRLNLGIPVKTLKFKKYSIFVYDYNISSKFKEGKKVYYLIRGKKSGIYIAEN